MARSDISDKLIHFTKGDDYDESLKSLFNILRCGRLIGGTGKIKGGFPCVCFTEAPLPAISHAFVADGRLARYSPFGVIVSKKWLFERGGRPVIYQSDAEFQALPAEMRWRHVRYEPNGCPPTDFSWEREWRIRTDALEISASDATVVVPDAEWKANLLRMWNLEQIYIEAAYSTIFDETIALQLAESARWRIVTLR